MTPGRALTVQAWLAWGVAASLPFLLGRNPFPMLIGICAVRAVRVSFRPASAPGVGWPIVIRAAVLFAVIAVLFNVLTVRTGEQVIVTIPRNWPLIAGPVTWNAVVYGLLAAAGVLGLVMVWATVGSHVQWNSLARLLPDPFVGFAVAGSAAINLVPQTAAALTDIREASAARGYAPSGVRGVAAILTPMITVGLDRSMRLAEVLEARGFGGRRSQAPRGLPGFELGWTLLLGGGFIGGYGLIAAIAWAAIGGIAAAGVGTVILARVRRPDAIHRTRYRHEPLAREDWVVIGLSAAVSIACIVARSLEPRAFAYEPYPEIRMPVAVLWPLVALLGLFAPALAAPAGETTDD
jgi:energy-coupling factor transport system permease protein